MSTAKYPQKLVSAKRKRNERSGIHAWHPYYAGYSEAFVSSAIQHLQLHGDSLVLDPWSGSGTTQLVCAKSGIRSLGFDINPVMTIFTNAKSGSIVRGMEALEQQLLKLIKEVKTQNFEVAPDDPLLEWMDSSLVSGLRGILKSIRNEERASVPITKLFSNFAAQFEDHRIDCLSDFLTAGLFVTGRELALYSGGSNPTWTKAKASHKGYSIDEVLSRYLQNCKKMLSDVGKVEIPSFTDNIALNADSRDLPLVSNSVDAVITSPPYLTRIDYAMSTKPEILLLSDEVHLRKTRENTMGAPVIVDKDISVSPNWGQRCVDVLEAVRSHSTKAARSYYLPNMLQYFRDAEASLDEIIRVLKPGGKALIVVQSSYFKEIEIDLGEIYSDMAVIKGCKAGVLSREIIRGHMAHVNSKSSEYKENKIYVEDVVELEKA